jgi:hypothetical protein
MKGRYKNILIVVIIPTIIWLVLLSTLHLTSSDSIVIIRGINSPSTEIPLWIINIVILFGYSGSILIGLIVLYEKIVWKEI